LVIQIDEFKAFIGNIKNQLSSLEHHTTKKYIQTIQTLELLMSELKENDYASILKKEIKKIENILGEYINI
jgi:hypothetical protein